MRRGRDDGNARGEVIEGSSLHRLFGWGECIFAELQRFLMDRLDIFSDYAILIFEEHEMGGKNDRKIGGIFKMEMLVLTPQALASGIGLILGRNILCKLANNSPLAHHTRDKLGCCIISYRNIISFFSWHFLGNFFANLKLSFNRGNPTSLLNSYLTSPSDIFVLFCHYLCNKKLNMGVER